MKGRGQSVLKHIHPHIQVWKRLYGSFKYSRYTHWQLICYFLSLLSPRSSCVGATRGQDSLSGPQEHQGLKCPPLSVSVRHLSRRAVVFFCINLGYLLRQSYYAHGGSIMSKASLANLQSLWIKKTVIYQIWHAQKSLQSRLWKHLKQYSWGSAEVKCNIKYILDASVGIWVLDACQHSVLFWTTVLSFWAATVLPLSNSALTVWVSLMWFQTLMHTVRLPISCAQTLMYPAYSGVNWKI